MTEPVTVSIIPVANLAIAVIPARAVIAVFYWWQMKVSSVVYAFTRMLVQLLLVG